jgi:hypothetical protein
MFIGNNWSRGAHQMSRLSQSHYLADCGGETTDKSDRDIVICSNNIKTSYFLIEIDETDRHENPWSTAFFVVDA